MNQLLCDVKKSGLLTSIQDLGRPGFRKFGVPVSGVMDVNSARLANKLVGNPTDFPLLEITQTGPQLHFKKYGALAITGADISPLLNGISIPNNETIFFSKGDELSFQKLRSGVRAYLAFSGELQAEWLFNSASTHVGNQWGGLKGKPLSKGDQLFLFSPEKPIQRQKSDRALSNSKIIRVSQSVEFDGLETEDKERLFSQEWIIASESNRMGIRLTGKPLKSKIPEMISSPTDLGIMQLPPSGQPIILMNDSASIGGYPRICALLQDDIPLLAQKPPGASIHFRLSS